MANTLHTIAQELYEDEFIDHEDVTQAQIYMWIRNNLGKINVFLYTDFQIVDEVITPPLGDEEKVILKEMYLERYYSKLARSALKGTLSASTTEWIMIKDGDNTIQRMNKNEVAKNLRMLAGEHKHSRESMIKSYNAYQSYALDVEVGDS